MDYGVAVPDKDFWVLSQKVEDLSVRMREVRDEVKSIDAKVDGLLSRFDRIDGGMKVAMGVSGFLGAAAMLIMTKLLPLLFAGLPRI